MRKNADICPCIDCVPPKRTSDCHAKCPEYAEYYNINEEKKQAKKEFEQVDKYFATRSKYVRKWNQ